MVRREFDRVVIGAHELGTQAEKDIKAKIALAQEEAMEKVRVAGVNMDSQFWSRIKDGDLGVAFYLPAEDADNLDAVWNFVRNQDRCGYNILRVLHGGWEGEDRLLAMLFWLNTNLPWITVKNELSFEKICEANGVLDVDYVVECIKNRLNLDGDIRILELNIPNAVEVFGTRAYWYVVYDDAHFEQ